MPRTRALRATADYRSKAKTKRLSGLDISRFSDDPEFFSMDWAKYRNSEYSNGLMRIQPDYLTAYWPLNEKSGTVINDVSGHGCNGSYFNAILGQPGIGDGNTCVLFDGTGRGNMFSPALQGLWNSQESTIQIWLAVLDASIWTTDALFCALFFGVDGVTTFLMEKNQASGLHQPLAIANTGGVLKFRSGNSTTTLNFMNWTMTYSLSNNRTRFYQDGVKVGADTTAAPAWVGLLGSTRCVIGSQIATSQVLPWKGRLAHLAIWSKELTPTEVARLATLNP